MVRVEWGCGGSYHFLRWMFFHKKKQLEKKQLKQIFTGFDVNVIFIFSRVYMCMKWTHFNFSTLDSAVMSETLWDWGCYLILSFPSSLIHLIHKLIHTHNLSLIWFNVCGILLITAFYHLFPSENSNFLIILFPYFVIKYELSTTIWKNDALQLIYGV